MSYIVFEKHPGDLLSLNTCGNYVIIEIEHLRFKVLSIKPMLKNIFKVSILIPPNSRNSELVVKILNKWLDGREIVGYDLSH